MDKNEEKTLIEQAQGGNANAFEALVNEYYETMFKMTFKYCGNRDDAQDITQDACIKLARGIHSFKGDSAFTSWLYRLIINTAKDWFKKQNRHPSNPEGMETAAVQNKSEEQLYAQQVLAEVHKLPDGEKEALLLVMSEGFTHKEAAEILDCKESTVSWRIHEARKKLSVLFKEEQKYG